MQSAWRLREQQRKQAAADEARRRAVEDVLWALINSSDFVFNH
jgi:hypothetical protein